MTGVSPFFANKGYHPSLMAEQNAQVSSIGAQCFISDLDDLHVELKWSIAKPRNATRSVWMNIAHQYSH